MSERGSPADHTGTEIINAEGGAPAGASAEGVVENKPGSGDANLSDAAASSAAGDPGAKEAPKPTLKDVIKTAVAAPESGEGNSPDPAKDGKVEGAADGQGKPGEKADDKDVPFHNHPRWKEVTAQNKQLTDKVSTLEPAAQQFGKITEFMEQHQLSHEEVGEGFIIMAMIKAGDARGLQKLDEYRDKLATALGEKLPDDIKGKIESGEITEEAGKELSKARAGKVRSDAEADRVRNADTERQRKEQAETTSRDFQTATLAWATDAKKTDPDFAKKEPAITRYSRALMQERGFPQTREQAVQIVKDAYAEVNKDFAAALPPKSPVKHVASASSSHGAKTEPKTLSEAVRQSFGKS